MQWKKVLPIKNMQMDFRKGNDLRWTVTKLDSFERKLTKIYPSQVCENDR